MSTVVIAYLITRTGNTVEAVPLFYNTAVTVSASQQIVGIIPAPGTATSVSALKQ